jgi:hypothetical protein
MGMIRVKLTTAVSLLLLLTCTYTMLVFFVRPANAASGVSILSHTGYVDSSGDYHVVGEVQNTGDQAANLVTIDVAFYNSSDALIADRFDQTMLDIVLPQGKSPFDIALLDTTLSARVDHYMLNVTSSTADSVPANLEVLTDNSYVDNDGSMHIPGEVTNLGNEKATNVKLVVTYYNNGTVVAATSKYLDPEEADLNPDQTKPFDLQLSEDRTSYVDSYEVTAESTEYLSVPEHVAVPEFSALELVLVFFAMLAIVAIGRQHLKPARGFHKTDPYSPGNF